MAKYKIKVPYKTGICLQLGPQGSDPNVGPPCLQSEDVNLIAGDVIEATPNTDGSVTFTYKTFPITVPSFGVEPADATATITFPVAATPNPNNQNQNTPATPTSMSANTKKWILIIISVIIILAILNADLSGTTKLAYIAVYAVIGAIVYYKVLYPNGTNPNMVY